MTGGLALDGVGFHYRRAQAPALRDVTLSVGPGEVLAVVGPSGSGKSTLLRLVCGLLEPSSGQLSIGGRDMAGVPPERRPVAMVFQGFALFPHLTVRENIAFGMRVRRVPREERARRVTEAATALRLDALLDRLPSQLSGGERQRTALARSLVRDPVVFCLDEPLSSLDPVLRASARRELADLLRADGRCAVYVTHDQSEAMTAGDRVAVLRDGVVEQVDAVRDLYERPATAFVASFVGTPPMSLLPADLVGSPVRPPFAVPAGATLGVRAEDVRLDLVELAHSVTAVEDVGSELHVVLDIGGFPLVVRVPPGVRVVPGDRVGVRVLPERVHVFDASGRAVALGPVR
ncbi:MAG TPA: ABC transporter ATP-binding protein [Mycobacteriales bacterium]|nr:ABC transporter ATP-binding protein [Mycobacteriales bacterium]